MCRFINVEGLTEWIAVESEDERVLKWLSEELSLQLRGVNAFAAEHLVVVTTN
jgi:hypothetical protein